MWYCGDEEGKIWVVRSLPQTVNPDNGFSKLRNSSLSVGAFQSSSSFDYVNFEETCRPSSPTSIFGKLLVATNFCQNIILRNLSHGHRVLKEDDRPLTETKTSKETIGRRRRKERMKERKEASPFFQFGADAWSSESFL